MVFHTPLRRLRRLSAKFSPRFRLCGKQGKNSAKKAQPLMQNVDTFVRKETHAEHKSLQSLRQQNLQAGAELKREAKRAAKREAAESEVVIAENPVGEGKEDLMDEFDRGFKRNLTRTKLAFVKKLEKDPRGAKTQTQSSFMRGQRSVTTQTILTTRPMSFRSIYLDDADWGCFVDFIHRHVDDLSP